MKISEMIDQLEPDEWRVKAGFSADISLVHQAIFANPTQEAIRSQLAAWLQKHQPCLFGRIAAKYDQIHFCILTPTDLLKDDAEIRTQIQAERVAWKNAAASGRKSGFIVLATSDKIANCKPNANLQQIAQRLCELYLRTESILDEILMETVCLDLPNKQMLEWKAGVNYFCATGDKRWWHDHRIPGGLAFSVNSVGHMVRAGVLKKEMKEYNELFEFLDEGEWSDVKVDSLNKSLGLAMRTIHNAADTVSGKATNLIERKRLDKCPVRLPRALEDKDFSEYRGWYHTDVTLPAEYFRPEVERPAEIEQKTLDFTYLFDDNLGNPAYDTMGTGVRVRSDEIDRATLSRIKRRMGMPKVLPNEEAEQMRRELGLPD